MRLVKVASILLLMTHCSISSAEENFSDVETVLIAAKFVGGCDVVSQMAAFHQKSRMSGSGQFVIGFINSYAERSGMSPDEYLSHCKKVSKELENFNQALAKDKKPEKE